MRPQKVGRPQQGQNERNPYQRIAVRSLTGGSSVGGTGLFGGVKEDDDSSNADSPDGVTDNDDNDTPNQSMTGSGSPQYQAKHPILNSIFGGGRANNLAAQLNAQSAMEDKSNNDATNRIKLESSLRGQNSLDEMQNRAQLNQQNQDQIDSQLGNDIINHPQGLKILGNMGYDPINSPESIDPLDVGRSARNNLGTSLNGGIQAAENSQEGEQAKQPFIQPLTRSNAENLIAKQTLDTTESNARNQHDINNPNEMSDLFTAENEKGGIANANISSETNARNTALNAKPTNQLKYMGNLGPASAGIHLFQNTQGDPIAVYPEMLTDKFGNKTPTGNFKHKILDLDVTSKKNIQDVTQPEDIDAMLGNGQGNNQDQNAEDND